MAYHPVIWGTKGSWFDRLGFMIRAVNTTDHDNTLTDRDISAVASYTGPLQSYSEVSYSRIKEFYNGVTYDKDNLFWYAAMKPASGVSLSFVAIAEDAIDSLALDVFGENRDPQEHAVPHGASSISTPRAPMESRVGSAARQIAHYNGRRSDTR